MIIVVGASFAWGMLVGALSTLPSVAAHPAESTLTIPIPDQPDTGIYMWDRETGRPVQLVPAINRMRAKHVRLVRRMAILENRMAAVESAVSP